MFITFSDSVDLFLAKQRNESQTVTIGSSEDQSASFPVAERKPFSPEPSLHEEEHEDNE